MSKADVEIIVINLPLSPIRVYDGPDINRDRRAHDDMKAIARESRSTAEFRSRLKSVPIMLTRHYRNRGYTTWDDPTDSELRGLKGRILKGHFPPF